MTKRRVFLGRVCAICGERTNEPTYGFARFLRWHGLPGALAHVRCVAALKEKGPGETPGPKPSLADSSEAGNDPGHQADGGHEQEPVDQH